MTRHGQTLLILNGAILVFLAMVIGIPEFRVAARSPVDDLRWFLRQSHSILVTTGVWFIATGAVLPLLDLSTLGVNLLVWSLIMSGYLFLAAVPIQAARLLYHLPVSSGQWWYPYLVLLILGGIVSLWAGILLIWGAGKALRHTTLDTIASPRVRGGRD
jgi:hypothetical protein